MLGETSKGRLGAPGRETLKTIKNKDTIKIAIGKEIHPNSIFFFIFIIPKVKSTSSPIVKTSQALKKFKSNKIAKNIAVKNQKSHLKADFSENAMVKASGNRMADKIAMPLMFPIVLKVAILENGKGKIKILYNCSTA